MGAGHRPLSEGLSTQESDSLRARIKAITHGEELEDNDLDQLEREVRRIIFGKPREGTASQRGDVLKKI
jgi:hypothetical protein